MKKLILVFICWCVLVPSIAEGAVWITVYARNRDITSSPEYCVDKVDGEPVYYPALTDESSCTGAGHTWWVEFESGRRERGDIVSVSTTEPNQTQMCAQYPPASGGAWVCVEITDKDEVHARNYIQGQLDSNLIQIQESRFYVDVDSLPAAVKDTLWDTGTLSRTWAQVKVFIIDKETELPVP